MTQYVRFIITPSRGQKNAKPVSLSVKSRDVRADFLLSGRSDGDG